MKVVVFLLFIFISTGHCEPVECPLIRMEIETLTYKIKKESKKEKPDDKIIQALAEELAVLNQTKRKYCKE